MSFSVVLHAEPRDRVEPASHRPSTRWAPHEAAAIPDVRPGQLWLIEALPADDPPDAVRRALAAANVVIYDRELAPLVAALLPLGGYAEPAAEAPAPTDPSAERCVRFARDGWSVVRLVVAGRDRADRVRRLAARLDAARAPADLPVSLFAETGGGARGQANVPLHRLAAAVAAYPRHDRLTIVIDATDAAGAPRLYAVAANGLAG